MNRHDDRASRIIGEMESRFGDHGEALFYRAPGRVDLMGSHTDYNQGLILAAAIDRDILVAARPRSGGVINLYSLNTEEEVRVHVEGLRYDAEHGWANYPKGVLAELLEVGVPLDGLDLVFHGEVPVGGNLSSSAALEAATMEAALGVAGFPMPVWERVQLARRAENVFMGVPCGIMDQFTVFMGEDKKALELDCATLQYKSAAFAFKGAALFVVDSGQGRELASGMYAERVKECRSALAELRKVRPGLGSLSGLSVRELDLVEHNLEDPERKRARHIITENERVRMAADALNEGDPEVLGDLMEACYRSCRDDFENSTPELDELHDLFAERPEVLGSRICGAGWGGCLLALIERAESGRICEEVLAAYHDKTGLSGRTWEVKPSAGAGPI